MVWLASSVRLLRNVEKFFFPGKLNVERKSQIVTLLHKELLSNPELQGSHFYKADKLNSLEKEFLVEHFLSQQLYHQAGEGEAFVVDDKGEFITEMNLRNHMQMSLLDGKGELENTLNRLIKIESALGKTITYSYSPKFGFLTADPTECGTALQVTAFLQLSALIHSETIDDLLEKYADDSITITGIQGNPTEIIGDVIAAQNTYTLGLTEENVLSSLRNFITKILVEEHAERNRIKQTANPVIKDKVSRAYGILIHSYQIEAVEALNAISLLKLGVDLGWVTGIDSAGLNTLFSNCRRAHLLCQYEGKISQDEIPHKRSEFIHKKLNGVQLTI